MDEKRRFLIDTHIFIWWMEKSSRLPANLYKVLDDPHMHVYISVASIWELLIKIAKEKLKAHVDIDAGIKASKFIVLPITLSHVLEIEKLPLNHHDPFDRILIAQARVENFTFITVDEKIQRYDVKLL